MTARPTTWWARLVPVALWLSSGACNLVSGLDAVQIAGCATDADCDATQFCVVATHACALRLSPGSSPCLADDECTSAVCGINGVCCIERCEAPGDTCGATGCAGVDGVCTYPPPSTVCTLSCSGSTLETINCDGSGRCAVRQTAACPGNLSCLSPTACGTACGGADGTCIAGYYCAGTCQALKPSGTICASAQECVSQACNCDACGSCVCG